MKVFLFYLSFKPLFLILVMFVSEIHEPRKRFFICFFYLFVNCDILSYFIYVTYLFEKRTWNIPTNSRAVITNSLPRKKENGMLMQDPRGIILILLKLGLKPIAYNGGLDFCFKFYFMFIYYLLIYYVLNS